MPMGVLFAQDTIHLAVKREARLLNPNVALKLGPKFEAAWRLSYRNVANKAGQGRTLFKAKRCRPQR